MYFEDIPLIDCTMIEMPDSCFADCLHLNYKGAQEFKAVVDSIISTL